MEMDPSPKQPVRRRTSKQLERKRELDKQSQRIKRETDKDRLIQIQADVQKIQRQMDSLQKTMAMILDGMNTLHNTHPSAHLSQSSSVSLPVDIPTPKDGGMAGTRGDSSSSSSSSSLTSNPAHGEQAPPKLYGDTDRSLLVADCSVVSRELNHSPVVIGSLPESNDSCSPYAQDSVQLVTSALHPSETGADQTTLNAYRQTRELCNRDPISVDGSKAPPTIYTHIDTSPPTIFKYRGVALPSCLCQPRVHSSYADCFEYTVYDAVIKAHVQPQTPPVPLSPSLPDLLFVGEGNNVVSRILFKMLKRDGLCGIDVLLGAYILLYRLLRVSSTLICSSAFLLFFLLLPSSIGRSRLLTNSSTVFPHLSKPSRTYRNGFDRLKSKVTRLTKSLPTSCHSLSCATPWFRAPLSIPEKSLILTTVVLFRLTGRTRNLCWLETIPWMWF